MNIITRAQELGKKAAQLSQAVHALPGHAAKIREAVTMTGGELKQLRSEVQSSVQGLRADSEDHLLTAMRELNNHSKVFEDAGYDLDGMDLDLALNQRLAVHLERFETVPHAILRSLLERQSSNTVRSVLNGIIKAEETAANVELSHLVYRGLIIHIGVVPMVRMQWRDAAPPPAAHVAPARIPEAAPPPAPAAASSMFDLRPLPGGSVRVEPRTAPPPPNVPAPDAVQQRPAVNSGSAWSSDALARFKQMPGYSKYNRG